MSYYTHQTKLNSSSNQGFHLLSKQRKNFQITKLPKKANNFQLLMNPMIEYVNKYISTTTTTNRSLKFNLLQNLSN
jgi:hypothetical protein